MSVRCIRNPLVPSALRSCVAVGNDQVPRFWATVHDLTEMMALAPSTRRNALAGIDAFYAHVEAIHGDDVLDRLLVDLDIDSLSSALEAFLVREQNLAAAEQRVVGRRWVAASRFVLSRMTVRSMFEDASQIDPRASQPSLKNAYAPRQIPVTDRVAMLIRDFSTKFRRATRDTDALFVSNRGRPLSKRMLESLMARADAACGSCRRVRGPPAGAGTFGVVRLDRGRPARAASDPHPARITSTEPRGRRRSALEPRGATGATSS